MGLVARDNLAAVGSRHTAIVGTFEEHIDRVLGERGIDIGFVDAIHRSEIVREQYAMLVERSSAGALLVFDDINFSEDMARCWRELATGPLVLASAEVSGRVGVIELRKDGS